MLLDYFLMWKQATFRPHGRATVIRVGRRSEEQSKFWEWMVARELWRRRALSGEEFPDSLSYWTGGGHEVDFVTTEKKLIEVKRGAASPLDFLWFPKSFPKRQLTVINEKFFETPALLGLTMEKFLLSS